MKKLKDISFGTIAKGEASFREASSTKLQNAKWTAIVDSRCNSQMFTYDSNIKNIKPSAKVIKKADGKLIRAIKRNKEAV
jgi:hypothetical protein